MHRYRTPAAFLAAPIIFAAAAAASRMLVQSGIESRVQILFFWVIAGIMEVGRGDRASGARFIVTAIAIAGAIIAVKIYLEGIPPRLTNLL
ncbi:hypothetical protein [Novosphingobium sp. P6W]|uniref:hypothetical protein n=1 Tax=Novosphingobium sp. P6W TaxID=1609758 RepID=UPI0005C4F58D|nr:hypothetical protein [Novosphingobium sp. P6W]AXB80614.1 hypothetical protein TQ38_028950 [Novosphingobium sp. P6W]